MAKLDELNKLPNVMLPGSGACAGCGATLTLSHILKVLVSELHKKVILVVPASCWLINVGRAPYSVLHDRVLVYNSLFASASATAAGFADSLRMEGSSQDTVVAVFAGDGSTGDIGFAAVSAAAMRNDNILYIANDNEAYENTGVQDSSLTPFGAITTTTPKGASSRHGKKDIDAIMADHGIPYAATATLGSANLLYDFYAKIRKAALMEGFRFIHILDPCPPGWKSKAGDTAKLGRLAVHAKVFPLAEYESGHWHLTYDVKKPAKLEEYLELQGRFAEMTAEDVEMMRKKLEERYEFFRNAK